MHGRALSAPPTWWRKVPRSIGRQRRDGPDCRETSSLLSRHGFSPAMKQEIANGCERVIKAVTPGE
jgi:hypothetical protein